MLPQQPGYLRHMVTGLIWFDVEQVCQSFVLFAFDCHLALFLNRSWLDQPKQAEEFHAHTHRAIRSILLILE